MGSLVSDPNREAAFDGQIFKKGLDLDRSRFTLDPGTWVADPNAVIRAGMIVSRNATGGVIPAAGTDTLGVAKWGKTAFGVSVQVDLAVVLPGTTTVNLTVNGVGRGNVSNVTVRSLAGMAGTLFVGGGTDYTINAGNGTITRVGGGAIADGATVFVTFTYALVDADYEFDGRYWQNQAEDRVFWSEGRGTVISDWARLFTVEWATGTGVATGLTYTLTGATADLFCSAEGKFSNTASGEFMGKCSQVPTATDPYMGVVIHGNPVV